MPTAHRYPLHGSSRQGGGAGASPTRSRPTWKQRVARRSRGTPGACPCAGGVEQRHRAPMQQRRDKTRRRLEIGNRGRSPHQHYNRDSAANIR